MTDYDFGVVQEGDRIRLWHPAFEREYVGVVERVDLHPIDDYDKRVYIDIEDGDDDIGDGLIVGMNEEDIGDDPYSLELLGWNDA